MSGANFKLQKCRKYTQCTMIHPYFRGVHHIMLHGIMQHLRSTILTINIGLEILKLEKAVRGHAERIKTQQETLNTAKAHEDGHARTISKLTRELEVAAVAWRDKWPDTKDRKIAEHEKEICRLRGDYNRLLKDKRSPNHGPSAMREGDIGPAFSGAQMVQSVQVPARGESLKKSVKSTSTKRAADDLFE